MLKILSKTGTRFFLRTHKSTKAMYTDYQTLAFWSGAQSKDAGSYITIYSVL